MLAIAGTAVRLPPLHAIESHWQPASPAYLTWRHGVSGQLAAFERVGRGAMIVDDHARVLELNACVHLGDGLHVAGGVLQTSTATDRRRLLCFLSALTARPKQVPPVPATLTLQRPSRVRPWLLDAIDWSDTSRDPQNRVAALILITDVERPPRLSPDLLTQVFGLTSTEARVAVELASGKSLHQVSTQLAISEGHARQRLKAIFCKTGTSRQGELIALLAKLG
jgi:DNA-binding CsgD family transcriptional regulator